MAFFTPVSRLFLVLLCIPFTAAIAQTTGGDVGNGQALYTARACFACHGTTPGTVLPSIRNAANAGGIVGLATARNMGGFNAGSFTPAQENDLAAYVATAVTNPTSHTVAANVASTITLPDISLNSTFGAFSSTAVTTLPAKGTVIMSGTSAEYTPFSGQCGSDSFSWQASGTFSSVAYSSNIRTANITISNPSAPDLSTTPSTASAGFGNAFTFLPTSTGGAPSSYAISGSPPSWMQFNTSTGEIFGVPNSLGTFSVTVTAFNCANGNSTGQSASKTIAITVGSGAQTITFNPLVDRFNTDAPFVVTATGGGSGNPVIFSASGICTSSGSNGSTITLNGQAGACSVTANQAAGGNYLAATPVTRTFNVAINGSEVFPPFCQIPPGWINGPALSFNAWVITNEAGASSEGICAFKAPRGFGIPPEGINPFRLAFTGTFNSGTISFSRRVLGDPFDGCLRFRIDGIEQSISGTCNFGTGAAGDLPHAVVNIPISAGNHTIEWLSTPGGFYGNLTIEAWIDSVFLPLSTTITSASTVSVTVGNTVTYTTTGTNFPAQFSATDLPPGTTIDVMTGVVSGVATTAGTFASTITASNPGGANPTASASKTVTFTINKATQSISFGTIADQAATAAPLTLSATGGASGNPVVFTATGVCSTSDVSGTRLTLSGIAGTCTITANQAGNGNYDAAPAVSRTFQVNAVAPTAPVLTEAIAGNGRVTLTFSAPTQNGGSAILDYRATCGTINATATASPIEVTGLNNGTAYNCTVAARNVVGFGSASNSLTVTPTAITFVGVVSRKVHGAGIGALDIPISVAALDESYSVEPRSTQAGHKIVFQFSGAVLNATTIAVTDAFGATITPQSTAFVGNELQLGLPALVSGKRVLITLVGINGALDVETAVGFQIGDTNDSHVVSAADVSALKARRGLPVNTGNARFDLNVDGSIDDADAKMAKVQSGKTIP